MPEAFFVPLGFEKADETSNSISTGHLLPSDVVQDLTYPAHTRCRPNDESVVSRVYPVLAEGPCVLFEICPVVTSGNIDTAGDADFEFSIMSVPKPFVFAFVCQMPGAAAVRDKLTGVRT